MTVWASGSVQAEADRFDGTYAIDPGTLACVVGEGDVPGAAIRIEAGRFFGPAIVCQMQNPTNIRDMSAMLFDFACSGEGREWRDRTLLMRLDDGSLLRVVDGMAFTYAPCRVED